MSKGPMEQILGTGAAIAVSQIQHDAPQATVTPDRDPPIATQVTAQRVRLGPMAGVVAFGVSWGVRVRVLLFALLVGTGSNVSAQRASAADTLHSRKRPVRALGELFIVQIIPFSVNNVIRDKEWAKVSLQSWEENLENPWQWDNDHFIANQFGHPYHGNLYFNSARTNGYSFWASVPWAYGGSVMWRCSASSSPLPRMTS
ncbi:MAG TPA: DUF3943 domain-containing protein [Gemmatimonadales bacterium]|nr:DUF3943 domain-containing protein [Gemmatimonadales bacterium]